MELFPILILFAVAVLLNRNNRNQMQLEEHMVSNGDNPNSSQWEFKILNGWFKNPDKLRAVCAEEAQSGWDLFEKLDDSRVRLRRSISERKNDSSRLIDPYRTRIGADLRIFAALAFVVVAIVFYFLTDYKPRGLSSFPKTGSTGNP